MSAEPWRWTDKAGKTLAYGYGERNKAKALTSLRAKGYQPIAGNPHYRAR